MIEGALAFAFGGKNLVAASLTLTLVLLQGCERAPPTKDAVAPSEGEISKAFDAHLR